MNATHVRFLNFSLYTYPDHCYLQVMETNKMSRKDRRAGNVLLAAYGIAPIKEHRAPRERAAKYVVTTWTENGDQCVRVESMTLELARQSVKRFLLEKALPVVLADIAPIGDPDQALELWKLVDGKPTRTA